MSLDADLIVDRRRMRRKLTFWRVCAVIVAIGAVIAAAAALRAPGTQAWVGTAGSIARVTITGLIRTDQQRVEAAPNGFEPTSPEARAAVEAIVSDSYAWFRAMVKARRHLDDADLDRVADGRVFTGRQGVPLKLVDEIGDERAALAWLVKEKNIDANTPVRDYRLRERFSDVPFLHTAMVSSLEALGLSSFAKRLEEWGAVRAVA